MKYAVGRYLILLALCLTWLAADAQYERVIAFHSDLHIDTNSVLHVTERITIQAAGDMFKRGIVRYLPKVRREHDGSSYKVDYDLRQVQRDGKDSRFHVEENARRMTIYVGSKNVMLRPGQYTYTLRYSTRNQLGYFEDFDEIYWNVNGNGWDISMDKVTATVHLPEGAKAIQNACYTGAYKSTSKDCQIQDKGQKVHFTFDRARPREGLTIATGFTKGIVHEPPPPPPPSFFQRQGGKLLAAGSSLVLLIYYLLTWMKWGRDPEKPTVVPSYDPPEELSAASVGMVRRGFYSHDLLTASIIDLAIKGYLKIEQHTSDTLGFFTKHSFTIHKIKDPDDQLPDEERVLLETMFSFENDITISGTYSSRVGAAVTSFKKNISRQWNPLIWEGFNAKFWLFPTLFIILNLVIYLKFSDSDGFQWSAGTIITFIAGNLSIFGIYQWLIRRPSVEKLRLRSLIDGFEMYLGSAEEKQLQFFNPPDMTPDRFEAYLPYAIVLGVDKIWGKKFKNKMIETGTLEDYQPGWVNYRGTNWAVFSHAMNNAMSSTLSTASTPPSSSGSSSMGSGGGGFSGGGGGGGGGGGW